jgi:predicted metal-dependent peptidase
LSNEQSKESIQVVFDKIKATLMTISPFLSSMVRKAEVIIIDDENIIPTAAADQYDRVYLNRKYFESLSFCDKTFVTAHEVMHIAFRDCKRMGSRELKPWNVVTDSVNNQLIYSFIKCSQEIKPFLWDLYKLLGDLKIFGVNIDLDDFLKMNKEEIYKLLPKIGKGGKEAPKCEKCGSSDIIAEKVKITIDGTAEVTFRCNSCGNKWTVEGKTERYEDSVLVGEGIPVESIEIEGGENDLKKDGKAKGETLQEGDQEIYGAEDRDKAWKSSLVKAYTQQKLAGRVPAGLQIAIDQLLQSKVDWRTKLKQAFINGYGKTVVSTWKRVSRKIPILPGISRFTIPTVYFLADMSGSISKEEATQSMTEVYSLARLSEVKVYCWDAKVYQEIKARSQSDVISRVVKNLKGGGGTVVEPALTQVLKRMKSRDIVVIFTDGEIYDLDEGKTKQMFSKVRSKSSASIFLTTSREHVIPGWEVIKVEITRD